jgi:hypothetical protein
MSYQPRDASGNYLIPENTQVGSTYTAHLDDAGKIISFANPALCTIPANVDVPYPIGTQLLVTRSGAGPVTIGAGAGVTINSAGAMLEVSTQFATVGLLKTDTDTWLLAGSLS